MNHFEAPDGLKLATQDWLIKSPKANVIALHGYAEHILRYNYEAAYLNENGYNVYGYDLRGHGRSEGERAYVDSFNEYLNDLESFIKLNSSVFEERPFFFFAHSMGALILFSHLINTNWRHPNLKGIVLSAPALKINPNISPLLQKVSGVLGAIAPKLQTVALDNTKLSHDPQVFIDHEADALNYKGKAKARMGAEMLKQMKWSMQQVSKFDYPFLTMHGTLDEHAAPAGSDALFNNSASKDKELKKWEGMYHEITKELDKSKVMAKMIDWMNPRI